MRDALSPPKAAPRDERARYAELRKESIVEELNRVRELLRHAEQDIAREVLRVERDDFSSEGPLASVMRAMRSVAWVAPNAHGHLDVAAMKAAELDALTKTSSMQKAIAREDAEQAARDAGVELSRLFEEGPRPVPGPSEWADWAARNVRAAAKGGDRD